MSSLSWVNREQRETSKKNLKKLGKPFRRVNQKDSKQSREWSKLKKKLQKEADQEVEEVV